MSVQLHEGSPSHWMPKECRDAVEREKPSHLFALFSGGHDSLCSTHIASGHPGFSGVIHCNTGFGIEKTREYVRSVCADRNWPLHELHPAEGEGYEDLVLKGRISKTTGKKIIGLPCGPKSHNTMLWYLKEKPLRKFIQGLKTHRSERFGLVTGIRTEESQRRMGADMSVPVKRNGAYLWLNPILDWEPTHKNSYMAEWGLPRNPVVDLLHRSGECLCGALARREELADIAGWFPQMGERITDLERRTKELGIEDRFWAMQSPVHADQEELFDAGEMFPLCNGCKRHYEMAALTQEEERR